MARVWRWSRRVWSRRVQLVPQLEAAECGAACLAMVLDYHGSSVPLAEVRARVGTGRDGVNAGQIYQAARHFGLSPKALRLSPAELGEVELPAILHWEFNHFVVLDRLTQRGATVLDPAFGRRRVSASELGAAFTGVALFFTPEPGLTRRRARSPSLRRYAQVMRSLSAGWLSLLGAALLLEAVGLGVPAANQVLIDHVLIANRADWFWPLTLILCACSVSFLTLVAIRDRVVRRLSFALDLDLMSGFVRHLLSLPLRFHQERSTGDLLQRVSAHKELRKAALDALTGALDALLVASYAALMLAYDATTSAALLGLVALRVLCLYAVRPRVAELSTSHLAEHGKELGALVEPLAAPELIRAFGAETYAADRYQTRLVARLNAESRRDRLHQASQEVSGLIGAASHAAAIALAGQAVLDERITLGVFTTLLTLQGLLSRPLESALGALSVAARARGALTRIDDVLDTPMPRAGTARLVDCRGELTLEDVCFRYDARGPLLCDHVTLRVAPGEKVALVGRIGQGKTTLLRLMSGLLEPTEGRVLLDGVPLGDLCPDDLRRHLGVVLQDAFAFDTSVRQNLSLRKGDAPESELWLAAETAGLREVIEALPEGLDTPLGENASRLSGGERQRLALARALVGRPALVILDEATSSLDLATEQRVHQRLAALTGTRVLAAHRLETVRDADRILVIDQGRIVEQGGYGELRTRPGLFSQLLESYERSQS